MRDPLPENIVSLVVAALTRHRKEKGLSHEKLADKAGLHRSAISLIESGKRQPTLLSCLKITTAMEVSLGSLIAEAEKTAKKEK